MALTSGFRLLTSRTALAAEAKPGIPMRLAAAAAAADCMPSGARAPWTPGTEKPIKRETCYCIKCT